MPQTQLLERLRVRGMVVVPDHFPAGAILEQRADGLLLACAKAASRARGHDRAC